VQIAFLARLPGQAKELSYSEGPLRPTESAPTLAKSWRLVVCGRSQAVGPDSIWEQPGPQVGSYLAVLYSRPTRPRGW
jgi:hypothetical protein